MWLLSFLPDSFLLFIVNSVLIAGIVGTVISFFFINKLARRFPSLAPYYWLLQILSIVVLVAGVYFKGGYSVEQEWRDRVGKLEEQVKLAEAKSAQTNTVIQEKIVTKTKVIRDTQIVNRDRIVENRVEIDKDCVVAPEAIEIHNAAAKNVILEPLK
jgi:energy-coupling factor transporter transmembrane protein EcfT